MNEYVLDTDTITLYQWGNPGIVERVSACRPDELACTIISVEELLTGWYTKLRRAKKRDQIARAYQSLTNTVEFFTLLRITTFTEVAIERYEQLRSVYRNIGKNDLRIAAIVLERGSILITRNMRDFSGIRGLRVEDWSSG